MSVPLAKALISQGFVKVKAAAGQNINYCCLKRSNVVVNNSKNNEYYNIKTTMRL